MEEQIDMCLGMADMLLSEGERGAIRRIIPQFITGCRGCRPFRNEIASLSSDPVRMRAVIAEAGEALGDLRMDMNNRFSV